MLRHLPSVFRSTLPSKSRANEALRQPRSRKRCVRQSTRAARAARGDLQRPHLCRRSTPLGMRQAINTVHVSIKSTVEATYYRLERTRTECLPPSYIRETQHPISVLVSTPKDKTKLDGRGVATHLLQRVISVDAAGHRGVPAFARFQACVRGRR